MGSKGDSMKKFWITIAAAWLAVIVVMVTKTAAVVEPRDTVHVVIVYGQNGEPRGNGSGVMVAPGLMLTAAHVVDSGRVGVGLSQAPAKVVKVSKILDLALLEVALACPCAPVASKAPKVDSPVAAIGYPSFNYAAVQMRTAGHIQGRVERDHRLMFSAPISGGNSGGGLFFGDTLVGIVVEVINGGNMFSSSPIYHIARAVDTESLSVFVAGYERLAVDPVIRKFTERRV